MKKKVVPTLRQEVKVKVDIVSSDDIEIHYTGKFQDFTARYIMKRQNAYCVVCPKAVANSMTVTKRQYIQCRPGSLAVVIIQ